jgi:hypothetical protein
VIEFSLVWGATTYRASQNYCSRGFFALWASMHNWCRHHNPYWWLGGWAPIRSAIAVGKPKCILTPYFQAWAHASQSERVSRAAASAPHNVRRRMVKSAPKHHRRHNVSLDIEAVDVAAQLDGPVAVVGVIAQHQTDSPQVVLEMESPSLEDEWQPSRSAKLRAKKREAKLVRSEAKRAESDAAAVSLEQYIASAEYLVPQYVLTSIDMLRIKATSEQVINPYGGCGCHADHEISWHSVFLHSNGYTAICKVCHDF